MERIGNGMGAGVRHATDKDLPLCQAVLQKLHSISIKHGNTNKHNFLIHNSRATMIDFDCASRRASPQDLEEEMRDLDHELQDTSGRGGLIRR